MIDIIITSYKEPKATVRAVKAILNQKIPTDFKITVVDPFPEVEDFIKREIKNNKVKFFLDPGEGKAYALNLIFQENPGKEDDFFILTDGDVYVSQNTIQEILEKFKDKKVGCVAGRPVPLDEKSNKYGYWSHFAFEGIHRVRKKLSEQKKFLECSGYLFAIRKSVIINFPLETAEDTIIPYLFWKKGYRIEYADKAEVYVKNPNNWQDYLNQKVRNIKAHENINKIASDMPRTKSLINEIKSGWKFLFIYPKTLQEFLWTTELYLARLYIYIKAFEELRNNKTFKDGWRESEIQSTKPFD